ncbi:restriction endonuclease subunit S [Intestinimonas massiliensis (ex Afouda et al. 2020)]|uniref:Restriction endonuclease subunit S n=1 Tax=Intestinimonas massiliensis (ex Afouda et al. 2020) TaxID=1673721 RepID=A0ABS9M8B1_9FIRM|nr:restriction endonuclease subunit S [Intestinimonas massiliensis (ex Afouda et al. 2020)]MCG4527052.1 restriction endonuclease subunit S [Intestinimonas massiliensis (ex Afouda et al. 2020)]
MTAQQLKNSILQMAVQGKLVPQDPNDEPASVLLERIRAEKERLIKEKKIKREKNPSVIFKGADNTPYEKIGDEVRSLADEVPFDIPNSWEWVRLSQIALVLNGDRGKNYPSKEKLVSSGIPFISALNLDGNTVINDANLLCVTEEQYNLLANGKLEKGDIVVCIRGSLGKHAKYPFEKGAIASSLVILRALCGDEALSDYIMMWLDSPAFFSEIRKYDNGTAQPNLAAKSLEQFFVPIPPISEQKRILEKLDKLGSSLLSYDAAHSKSHLLAATFPEALKKSILQEAVQGKLVPQDPTDESAETLLERIRAEKQRLIKEGKIKKDKHESIIFGRDNSHYEKLDGIERCIDDEIPFEIPDSWAWTSVGEVCTNIQYGSSQKSSPTGKIAVLRMGNLQNGRIVLDKLVYTSDSKEIEKYPLEYNDLLFNRTNSKELVGKVAIYKSEIPAIYAGYLVRLHPILIDSDYLNYVMQSQYYWIYCQNVRSDAIGQSNINAEKLKRFVFPLPPLQEQKRIVNQISCAMSIIEHL